MKPTTETAFEAYVEDVLLTRSGWRRGSLQGWDKDRALFVPEAVAFIQDTQTALWAQMRKQHGPELEPKVMAALCRELDLKGTLHVLRHGFKFYGRIFRMAYFRPAHRLNPDVLGLYAGNRLTVTRQVPCHPCDHSTVDLVFAVNGLPVATCELKNPSTHQTWRDAVRQYQHDRESGAPLFRFKKRAVVHFAVDPDEVHMATRLIKEKSFFLPFNRGSHPGEIKCGAGNPLHPSGHRTAYFWEEVLQRDSFLDILGHFMFVEHREEKADDGAGRKKRVVKETLIFPRYHQLDVVRRLVGAACQEGVGHNYLIQHSAGSGKTNSISWLAHRLSSLHNDREERVYDCVVVITDRQVLDRQLQDAIYQIEHAQGVVVPVDQDSKQLANALADGTQIVVTTIQKFPFVLKALIHNLSEGRFDDLPPDRQAVIRDRVAEYQTEISSRRYAVIVDEAHSSQTGETAREFKAILGAVADAETDEDADVEDRLNQIMASRGRQPNLSFFAFTATPKGKTLELFGRTGASGKPESFHTYSMRQAIEEGFILDVLRNYTTYKTFYRLVKEIEADPKLPKKKATRSLAKFMSLHPHNIEQKTEVMIEHFRSHVMHLMGSRAKAMVVTSSRLHAVRYMRAFESYLAENGYTDIRPLVAFSGTVRDPDNGLDYTEPGMNIDVVTGRSIGESQLPGRFDTPDYHILLVANKYQTGFNQPLLQTMYVDKRLSGVHAVQTLSRLNRIYPGKEAPFVLDFVNDAEEIYAAFKPYYDTTSLQETTDPIHLETLKHEMDEMQVYHWPEVEAFSMIFYKPAALHRVQDHPQMEKHLQPAVERFKALEDDDLRQLFRDKLRGYVNLYAFLSQIMPWTDPGQEKLYSFGRFLLPHLPTGREVAVIRPEDDVALRYYRLERIASGAIDLDIGDPNGVKSPTDVGTGKARDADAPLSDIIEALNERYGTEFTEEDRLFFEQIKEKACGDERIVQTANANPLDKFELGIRGLIESLMIQRLEENDRIVSRYMDDKAFQDTIFGRLAREIFETIKERGKGLHV